MHYNGHNCKKYKSYKKSSILDLEQSKTLVFDFAYRGAMFVVQLL